MLSNLVPTTDSLHSIYTEDALPCQYKRWRALLAQFKSLYGNSPSFVSRSPGRVNIIGEHIDYSLYGVLPMAITADVLLAVSTTNSTAFENSYEVKLCNIKPEDFPSHVFKVQNETVEIDSTLHEWSNYFKSGLKGAIDVLRKKYGNRFKPKSMKILMDGSLPVGGGLSSSAAFVSASALAVLFANGETSIDKTTLTELAIISERAVGVNTGGMDQSASVFSIRGSALYVSFMPVLNTEVVTFPKTNPELNFLIAQSFVQSDKHVTGPVCYNLRVVECSMAAAYLHATLNDKEETKPLSPDSSPLTISLRSFHESYFSKSLLSFKDQLSELVDLTKSVLKEEEGYTREEIARVIGCTVMELNNRFMFKFPVRAERFMLRQRAIHVFSEARRVLDFLSLLENQKGIDGVIDTSTEDFNHRLGNLMNLTQDSCRENYACSCPEIDDLCEIARRAGAYGSRLTGAGWGGCTVHLVPKNKLEDVKMALEENYYSKRKLTEKKRNNAVVISKPGSGSAVYVVGSEFGKDLGNFSQRS
ncbi:Galactokinase [Golovinomyces cichoracearum]|uniref:Galactokinase n=1 Tax=Golovinomyces cichoracearum TaxID=62708 RepID=A0A420ISR9_9PEZI|nr:Galactokinase [Golovinomyces cichoracearum]